VTNAGLSGTTPAPAEKKETKDDDDKTEETKDTEKKE